MAIVPTCGDVGRAEGLSNGMIANIPYHSEELPPQGTFLDSGRDEDVISQQRTVSSILIGGELRIEDWGKTPSEESHLFDFTHKRLWMRQKQVWLVTAAETGRIEIGGAQRHIPLRRRFRGRHVLPANN